MGIIGWHLWSIRLLVQSFFIKWKRKKRKKSNEVHPRVYTLYMPFANLINGGEFHGAQEHLQKIIGYESGTGWT